MKSRFAFFARTCLLSAAAYLLFIPRIFVVAQNVTSIASEKPSKPLIPDAEHATQSSLATLKSSVQRELDLLYARNGNAGQNLAVNHRAGKTKPKPTFLTAEQAHRQADPKTNYQTHVHKPVSIHDTSEKLSRKQEPSFLRNLAANPKCVVVPDSQPSFIRQIGHKVADVKQTSNQTPQAERTGKKSAIQRELEKLYNRDGRPMPSMTISDLPIRQKIVPAPSRNLTKRPGGAARRTNFVMRFLKRFVPFRSKFRRKKTTGIDNHKRLSVKNPRLLPRILRGNSRKLSTAGRFVVKSSQELKPKRSAQQSSTKVVNRLHVGHTEPNKIYDNGTIDGDLDDLFTEMSEKEADFSNNFSSALTLNNIERSVDELQPTTQEKPKSENPRIVGAKVLSKIRKTIPYKSSVAHKPKNTDVVRKSKRFSVRSHQKELKVFCLVALRDRQELLDVKPELSATYKSKVYYFSSVEAKKTFENFPKKYVPVADGKDVTLLIKKNGQLMTSNTTQIEGSLDHAVWYKHRLYLFASRDNLHKFVLAPAKYAVAN